MNVWLKPKNTAPTFISSAADTAESSPFITEHGSEMSGPKMGDPETGKSISEANSWAHMLDKLDQSQTETNQRFEQLREEMNQRFEQVDQRLSKLDQDVLSVKRDVAQLRSGQDLLFRKLDQRDAELLLRYGDLGNIKGKALEDMFAMALRYGLRNPDIQPDQIKLRQPIADPEGLIFRPGYVSEIDLIAQNGRLILFEVKATPVVDQVDLFASKVDLVKLQQPDKVIHAVFISLDAEQAVSQRCQALGLELVDSLEDDPNSV